MHPQSTALSCAVLCQSVHSGQEEPDHPQGMRWTSGLVQPPAGDSGMVSEVPHRKRTEYREPLPHEIWGVQVLNGQENCLSTDLGCLGHQDGWEAAGGPSSNPHAPTEPHGPQSMCTEAGNKGSGARLPGFQP